MSTEQKTPLAFSPSNSSNLGRAKAALVKHQVVNGIELDVLGRELAGHLTDRIRWHRERANVLFVQIEKLVEVEREAGEEFVNAMGHCALPKGILEKKVREHQDRAVFLTFVRDHLNADHIYRLHSTDLRMTGILPDGT